MKKIMRGLTLFIFLSRLANGSDFRLEIKGHYFNPSEQAFKEIYGTGLMYGGEASIGIWKNFELWVAGSYLSKKGELTFTKEETELKILPIGGGVKYRFLNGKFNFYGGAGLNYYQYKESSPIGDVNKSGIGYIGKIGSFIKLIGRLIIDFYMDYSYCRMKPADYEINIGGFEAGIGIGYEF